MTINSNLQQGIDRYPQVWAKIPSCDHNAVDTRKERRDYSTGATKVRTDVYFRPSQYDKVIHQWRRRPFVRERFGCFLCAPVGFEFKVNRTRRKIIQAKAEDDEQLIISDMVSSQSANVLFSISTDAGLKPSSIIYLDGDFVSRVFHGYSEEQLSEWVHGLYEWVEECFGQHINPEKLFIFYPPRPSRDGKNEYVVFFVQLENHR